MTTESINQQKTEIAEAKPQLKPSFAELAKKAAPILKTPSAPIGIVVEVNRKDSKEPKSRNRRNGKKKTDKKEEAKKTSESPKDATEKGNIAEFVNSKPEFLQPAPAPEVNIWEKRMEAAKKQNSLKLEHAIEPSNTKSGAGPDATGVLAYSNSCAESWPSLQNSMLATPPTSPGNSSASKVDTITSSVESLVISSPVSPPPSDVGDEDSSDALAKFGKKKWKPIVIPITYDKPSSRGKFSKSKGNMVQTGQKTSLGSDSAEKKKNFRMPAAAQRSFRRDNEKKLADSVSSDGTEEQLELKAPNSDSSSASGQAQGTGKPVFNGRRRRIPTSNGVYVPKSNYYYGNRNLGKMYYQNTGVGSDSVADYQQMMAVGFENFREWLRYQIEYYMSADNLCKDMYLRSLMDGDGFVLVHDILKFNRLQQLLLSCKPFALHFMGGSASVSEGSSTGVVYDELWVMPLILGLLKNSSTVELLCKNDRIDQDADDRIWYIRKKGDWANFM